MVLQLSMRENAMNNRLWTLVVLVFTTALLGEMKINPFDNFFRFSLGSAIFFFGLLSFRSAPILVTGFSTGIFVLLFRMMIDLILGRVFWIDSFFIHLPAAFYYFNFTLLVYVTKIQKYLKTPIRVGIIGACIDFSSNMVELSFRILIQEQFTLTLETIWMLLLFGILRSFCAVGLYNILNFSQLIAISEARQHELERLVMINTSLYEETFFLRKSMSHLEDITRKSYQLYMRLMELENKEASTALYIAEHVHEVKKDSQKILAGLSKLMSQEQLNLHISITDICDLVIKTNQKYAEALEKPIQFQKKCDIDSCTNHVYALLSVLNNLVSNAVEAIHHSGWVELRVVEDNHNIKFFVTDSGIGISEEDQDWIFEPGFTTKFDKNGNPSTGIGLTHAQKIVQNLNGSIQLSNEKGQPTQFIVAIPKDQLFKTFT